MDCKHETLTYQDVKKIDREIASMIKKNWTGSLFDLMRIPRVSKSPMLAGTLLTKEQQVMLAIKFLKRAFTFDDGDHSDNNAEKAIETLEGYLNGDNSIKELNNAYRDVKKTSKGYHEHDSLNEYVAISASLILEAVINLTNAGSIKASTPASTAFRYTANTAQYVYGHIGGNSMEKEKEYQLGEIFEAHLKHQTIEIKKRRGKLPDLSAYSSSQKKRLLRNLASELGFSVAKSS